MPTKLKRHQLLMVLQVDESDSGGDGSSRSGPTR
jgi:hypothetical protein